MHIFLFLRFYNFINRIVGIYIDNDIAAWHLFLADFEQKMTKNAPFLPYNARKWLWGVHLLFDLS